MAERCIVAMSGGVDSGVAALLVKQAGYETEGVTLRLHGHEELDDARAVAARLGIPFSVTDLRDAFRREVMDRFAAAYERGETPNPCIDCNRYVKLGKLFRRAAELGAQHVATGHYARVCRDEKTGRWLLKKGSDASKDQSYVLYALSQRELSMLLLPLGELTKNEVRAVAEANGFTNARKRDSQDICFVPDGDYAAFIRQYAGKSYPPGLFVGTGGEIYGEHKGVIHYTVGQRKGLGLSFPQPMYVCRIDVENNQVVLGKHEELFSRELTARGLNLIAAEALTEPLRVKAKVRYRQAEQPAVAVQTGPDELRVVFDEPQRAVTRGQAVVLYDGDTVVGGGTITEAGTAART